MKTLGTPDARILIITDFPSSTEKMSQVPLSDYAGGLFFALMSKKGLLKTNCIVYSFLDEAPPEEDFKEWCKNTRKTCPGVGWVRSGDSWISPQVAQAKARLDAWLESSGVQPALILTLGDAGLWWATGQLGAAKWRSSRLQPPQLPCPVLPLIHPRSLIRDKSSEVLFHIDLARAKAIFEGTQQPRDYKFKIEPSFLTTTAYLEELLLLADKQPIVLSGDLETRAGHIACFGIAHSETEAICIPFITINEQNPFYWDEELEAKLIHLIAQLFNHPNIRWIGQNFLYDCQYFWRFWGILPREVRDTMIGHHSIYSNMRKGLDFLSAMYAQDHVYWKDEIKEWDPSIGEKQYWTYNCKDACITWEIWPEIEASIINQGVAEHAVFQQDLFFPVLRMMNRGIRYDVKTRGGPTGKLTPEGEVEFDGLKGELIEAAKKRQADLDFIAGHSLNPKSPAQLSKFFYDDLGIPGVKNLAGDSLTTNSPAMALIAEREPMLKPVCQLIVELRSINVFLSTFIDAKLDSDGRMRCSFSIAGPTTYRFSSSENAFGSGMNLQNIPVAEKAKIKSENYIKLPNIRKLFIPDPGFTFFDMDLDRADLQVVIWEADDADMKKALHLGLDMHCVNACDIFDIKGIPYEELEENHPNYKDHRGRIGEAKRGKAKAGVHATNYGVGDRKLAQALGITVAEASRFRAKWFAAHPGVKRWHLRTQAQLAKNGYIENKFGARLYAFGDPMLPDFLGWLPQSTVAGVINRALVAIDSAEQTGTSNIQLLIQVHDSLAGQFPTAEREKAIAQLKTFGRVSIPYDDPLIIPVGIKTSEKSWGDCK